MKDQKQPKDRKKLQRNREMVRRLTVVAAMSAVGCTGGYITNQDGSQWHPSTPSNSVGVSAKEGVITISNATSSYQVWAGLNGSDTFFSFDPGALNQYSGNYQVNYSVNIPNGSYTFTVRDTHIWQTTNVQINNSGACPYTDYWNGQNTNCQLFHLDLLNCGTTAQPPYQSGNVTFVQMAQANSALCGSYSCTKNVQNVAGAFLVNPVIEDIYWGCPPGASGSCQVAANTNIWSINASETQFWSRMVEYGVGSGSYGGSFSDTPANLTAGTTAVTDSAVQTALLAELASGKVTTPYATLNQTNAVIFVIYLPNGYCGSFGGTTCPANVTGHHWGFIANGQHYYVALVNGTTSTTQLDAVSSHEVAEAATDADSYGATGCGTNTGCGWNEPSTNQGEIGDICNNATESINGHTVAQVFSQARCTCL